MFANRCERISSPVAAGKLISESCLIVRVILRGNKDILISIAQFLTNEWLHRIREFRTKDPITIFWCFSSSLLPLCNGQIKITMEVKSRLASSLSFNGLKSSATIGCSSQFNFPDASAGKQFNHGSVWGNCGEIEKLLIVTASPSLNFQCASRVTSPHNQPSSLFLFVDLASRRCYRSLRSLPTSHLKSLIRRLYLVIRFNQFSTTTVSS